MWRCTGIRWRDGEPVWTWTHPGHGRRDSRVRTGERLALAVPDDAVRRCTGVWRAGRHTECARAAVLRPDAGRDQCEDCAALDRLSSVAADTALDDPRPYAVYLAYFGPGVRKVGITAVERGSARLLEQAAICFTFLGRGPLMTARRTESVLGTALRVPDRVSGRLKRAARLALPPAAEREAELRALYDGVTGLPDTLERSPFRPVDHAGVFGLVPEPPRPTAVVTALDAGAVVTGVVRAVAGSDLYLESREEMLLLNGRLASGWSLTKAAVREARTTAPTRRVPPAVETAEPLF